MGSWDIRNIMQFILNLLNQKLLSIYPTLPFFILFRNSFLNAHVPYAQWS